MSNIILLAVIYVIGSYKPETFLGFHYVLIQFWKKTTDDPPPTISSELYWFPIAFSLGQINQAASNVIMFADKMHLCTIIVSLESGSCGQGW